MAVEIQGKCDARFDGVRKTFEEVFERGDGKFLGYGAVDENGCLPSRCNCGITSQGWSGSTSGGGARSRGGSQDAPATSAASRC